MMMVHIKKILLSFLLAAACITASAQTELELSTNLTLHTRFLELKSRSLLRNPSITDTISLGAKGFIDDFSYDSPYPDTSKWLDRSVYINRTFPKAPVTIGCATFDGLDSTGLPRNWTVLNTSSNISDYLTSKPIDLSVVPQNDNTVYLSFLVQPQGYGNDPESHDSIVLDFKGPATGWNHVWAKEGSALAVGDTSWQLVMIPVADSAYLLKGFQFRFYNYATINGNLDHWNLDYVYLNKGRLPSDTLLQQLSYVYDQPPILQTYSAMPWKQFTPAALRTSVPNLIRNNFVIQKNINYNHELIDNNTAAIIDASSGSFNLLPFDTTFQYTKCDIAAGCIDQDLIPAGVFPSTLTGPISYTVKDYFNTDTTVDFILANDTLVHVTELTNYFAYDDGTAENGFGLNAYNAQMAVKYTMNVADTLQYVDIYFNPIITNASVDSFRISVWNGTSSPATEVYTDSKKMSVYYLGTGLNNFIRYPLTQPFYQTPGTFFIGFTQNSNLYLNVGVDKNTNTQNNIFYNTTGTWNTSPYPGSLMMRPVFGSAADFVGIAEKKAENRLLIFPNPAGDMLHFDTGQPSGAVTYEVYDIAGRMLLKAVSESRSIDVSALVNGTYFLRVNGEAGPSIKKFIIAK